MTTRLPAHPVPGQPGHLAVACTCGRWHTLRADWLAVRRFACAELADALLEHRAEPYRGEWGVRRHSPTLATMITAAYAMAMTMATG